MNENRIDLIRPDAPALSQRGPHPIGVRSMAVTLRDQPNLEQAETAGHDRGLTLEIWYPAAEGTPQGGTYETLLRDGETEATLHGQACRDARCAEDMKAPLIVLSHGYPGNRFLMSHLAESLAAKGFVVAAPDHAGSTYNDQQDFGITLLHRPLDQRGVIDAVAGLGGDLGALADVSRVGVIGFSMGGYGALILAGAGLSQNALSHERADAHGLLARHLAGSASHEAMFDPRVKAVIPIGPWGNAQGMWNAAGLAGIRVPMMIMAGTADDVSEYAAMRGIFEGATGVERHLLSFENAGHNAAAAMPAPTESWFHSDKLGWSPFEHYADPVWDTVRMNNIAQHFAAAFLGRHLRDDAGMADYLDGVAWEGFAGRTAMGLRLESLSPSG